MRRSRPTGHSVESLDKIIARRTCTTEKEETLPPHVVATVARPCYAPCGSRSSAVLRAHLHRTSAHPRLLPVVFRAVCAFMSDLTITPSCCLHFVLPVASWSGHSYRPRCIHVLVPIRSYHTTRVSLMYTFRVVYRSALMYRSTLSGL